MLFQIIKYFNSFIKQFNSVTVKYNCPTHGALNPRFPCLFAENNRFGGVKIEINLAMTWVVVGFGGSL